MSSPTKFVPGAFAVPAGQPEPPPTAWAPLKVAIFRAIWIAYLVSLVGTWAREAGGPWLMADLTNNQPFWVSLVQTAGTLPICLLSIMAGVLADIVDRRKLLIVTHTWMLLASLLLTIVTLAGAMTPQALLGITVLLGIGAAMSGPAFQYVVPELVPPNQLPQAIALNSVALNIARAVGPALAMAIVFGIEYWTKSRTLGVGLSFLINALAFIGVIYVLIRWKRAPQKAPAHRETLIGATRTAFTYTRNSPALRAILIRVAAFILCAVIVWAQLVIIANKQIAKNKDEAAAVFGILMAAVGLGAVIGVIFMPRLEKRFSTDGMVALCTAIFGLALIGLSQCTGKLANIYLASALALVIGFNWVIVPTNFNIATQKSVPGWVKGRAIAMYLTVLWGSMAIGSPIWGWVASKAGIANASLIAGSLILLGLLLNKRFPLTRARGQDFSPANRADLATPAGFVPGVGGVQIVIEYHVATDQIAPFADLMHKSLRRQRFRNGAARWELLLQSPAADGLEVFRESIVYRSWSDRLRALARTTRADAALEDQIADFHQAPGEPVVTHVALNNRPDAVAYPRGVDPHDLPPHIHLPGPLVKWPRLFERFAQVFDDIHNRLMRAYYRRR